MRSIVSDTKNCYVCGTAYNLHKHHIFYGTGKRKLSDDYGCWCWLCAKHHNMSNEGVHFNKKLDNQLKELTQRKFNDAYPQLDFLKIFGRNYL